LQNDLMACKIANSEFREQRNDAILELEELKEELEEYDL